MNQLKLHIGCADKYIPGFIHVDIEPKEYVSVISDAISLPYVSNVVDMIYTAHLLEHFDRSEYMDALREWHRVLKPGGVLRLAVPDFAKCAKLYHEQGLADGLTGLIGLICGGQRDQHDYHKMVFDKPFLTAALIDAGFKSVTTWDWRETEHAGVDDYSQAHIPHMDKVNGTLMSLNLQAVK